MRSLLLAIGIAVAGSAGASLADAAGTAPQNTSPPTLSGTTTQGEALNADAGGWTGTQPISFAYQWRRCDSHGSSCAAISGVTGLAYTLTSADVGNTLRLRVTASNSVGSTSALSAATNVVKAPRPETLMLSQSASLVVFGAQVTLSGSVSTGASGENVSIFAQPLPFGSSLQVAGPTTGSGGAFSATVQPPMHTAYVAAVGNAHSNPVAVNVRPRLTLSHAGVHRFLVRAAAMRSMAGKYVLVQRRNRRLHLWVSVRRVFLTRATGGGSLTVVTRATFHLRAGGRLIRALMPLSQARPGYLSGSSNGVTG